MTKLTFEMKGLDELYKRVKWATPKMKEEVKEIVAKNGRELQRNTQLKMKAVYIKGYSNNGNRDNTRVYPDDNGFSSVVKVETNYFPYVEFGTRFMDAEPALKPAFVNQIPKFKADMKKLVKK